MQHPRRTLEGEQGWDALFLLRWKQGVQVAKKTWDNGARNFMELVTVTINVPVPVMRELLQVKQCSYSMKRHGIGLDSDCPDALPLGVTKKLDVVRVLQL